MKEVKKKSPARIYLTFAVVLVICGLIGGTAGYNEETQRPQPW